MKIKKENALAESLLEAKKAKKAEELKEEAAEETPDVEKHETAEGETTIVHNELNQNGTPKNSPAKIQLIIHNALTDVLDEALADALEAQADGDDINCNVLITGLPGSSKTKTVEGWADANGCNLFYLDAKNPDIQLLISGGAYVYHETDAETGKDKAKMGAAYSDALKDLELPRSILFLDELNRQVREGLRGSLLSLVAGHYVQGDGPGGKHHFDNLLFTIAAINPKTKNETGVIELQDAEKRRFFHKIAFDSTVDTTVAYLKAYYDAQLEQLSKESDKTSDNYMRKLKKYVLGQYLGLFIAKHPDFRYTTLADINDSEYYRTQRQKSIMCQSTLTELVAYSKGNAQKARAWVAKQESDPSGLNDAATQMLLNILDDYVEPIFEVEVRNKEKELGVKLLDGDYEANAGADNSAEDANNAADSKANAASSAKRGGGEFDGIDGEDDDQDFDADEEAEAAMEQEEDNFDAQMQAAFDDFASI